MRRKAIWAIGLLIGLLMAVLPGYGQRQEQKLISLDFKNVPVQKVFDAIEAQANMVIMYENTDRLKKEKVSITVKNKPLADVMNLLLGDKSLKWTIRENIIRVEAKQPDNNRLSGDGSDHLYNQPVTGTVVDSTGHPIPGASIRLLPGNKGASAIADGSFTIADVVPGSYKLQITLVGYLPVVMNITVAAANPLTMGNIALRVTDLKLQEVVVISTGYYQAPKERSTGSFAVVSADKMAQKSGSMNVVDRLEGLAPGVAFNYGQGNDKILMRGASSVNLDRQPLIILDGVPVAEYRNIESLVNPQDIKDITLLKDATAASIWGAQAANGVIVISTKTGQYNNERINVSYNGFVSFKGRPDYSSLNMMSSEAFINANKELFSTADYGSAFPYSMVSTGYLPSIYPHEQVYYDLQTGAISQATANQRWDSLAGLSNRGQIEKYFNKPAMLTSHNISLSGGGKSDRFFGSLTYNRYNNSDASTRDNYMVNLKEELKIARWLTFDVTGNMAYEKNHVLNVTLPTGFTLNNYTPYAMFAANDGTPLQQNYLNFTQPYQQAAETKSKINLNYSPVDEIQRNKNSSTSILARVNAGLRIELAKGLALSSRGQYQKTVDDGYNYYDASSYPVRLERVQFTQAPTTQGGTPTYFLPASGGNYYTSHRVVTSWTIRNQLEYNTQLAKDHQLTALAGVEMRNSFFDITNTTTRGYDFQTQRYSSFNQKDLELTGVSNPVLPQSGTSSKNYLQANPLTRAESQLRFLSYYGNLAYTYKERYNFNGSLRYDQSNLFGKSSSSQNKPIWSAGLSWNLYKEDFFNSSVFSKVTPRITYGIAGNSPKPGLGGPYDVLYAVSSAMFDGLGPGYVIISPANNQLSWEQTRIFNAGIDVELVSHRLSGSVDYYNKQTTDLLGDSPIDPTTGWYSYYGNIGNLFNKGVEVSITSTNVMTKAFKWTTNFNLAFNKNKITLLKRYTPQTPTGLVNGGFVEGYAAYSLFAYNYKGLDANGNPLALKTDGSTVSLTNKLANGDVLYEGTTQSPWYGGMTNTFTYHRFTLSGLIVYNFGSVMRDDVNKVYAGRLHTNISNTFEDRWKQPGDENTTNVPKYIPNQTNSDNQRSTDLYTKGNVNVVSAAYMKLRDVTLTYNVPVSGALQRTIRSLRVYGQMNNLMLWTKNKQHIDPEYYNLSTGTRLAQMPPFYTFGVNVDF